MAGRKDRGSSRARKRPPPKRSEPSARAGLVEGIPARNPDGSKLTKPQRLDAIADLMATNRFVTGLTIRKLAPHWGFSAGTIEKDSQEASRRFRVDPVEAAERKSVWLAQIQSALTDAVRAERYEAARGLLELLGKGQGFLDTSQRIELSGRGGGPVDMNLSNVVDLLSLADGDDRSEPRKGS